MLASAPYQFGLLVPLRHIREYLPCAEQAVIIIHLKMAMVPVGIAGVAYIANDLPLGHGAALADGDAA